jgi:hypothetical protein
MDQINSEILRQFNAKGLTINEGIAVDARLVKSASHPISNKEIKKLREKRNTPEGKVDKNGKPLKFCRDHDSDWVIKNAKPHYGLKEHASIDINHGCILATTLTPASINDTNYLSYCTIFSRHTKQPINKVYADKGYLPGGISLCEPAGGRIPPGEENPTGIFWPSMKSLMASCEKILPPPNLLNMRNNATRKSPSFDIS